jgi:hypothetical protein
MEYTPAGKRNESWDVGQVEYSLHCPKIGSARAESEFPVFAILFEYPLEKWSLMALTGRQGSHEIAAGSQD